MPTRSDSTPAEGLFFLHDDTLAKPFDRDWEKGQKFALIAFPSGVECELWESAISERGGLCICLGR